MEYRKYPGKLILLGEYSILRGSKALAIPVHRYFGRWEFKPNTQLFRKICAPLISFLSDIPDLVEVDLKTFKEELDHGLYFASNIPIGAGLGSSGAFSAAIFDRFVSNEVKSDLKQNLTLLKEKLGFIESFFHGKSSGTDPLVSYLDHMVLIQDKEVRLLNQLSDHIFPNFYILNTRIPRNTQELIGHFNALMSNPSFEESFETDYIPEVNQAIDHFLKNQSSSFSESMRTISYFQYQRMSLFIPQEIGRLWQNGLLKDQYYMKLCGAGGGGTMLIYCESKATIEDLMSQYDISRVQ